ncbi:MAG: hypothetical protein ACLQB1_12845, partial [Streptosporangiaceae bacterium]
MKNYLSLGWISWQTVVATLGVAGLLLYLTAKARQFIKQNGRRIIDAFFRILNRFASRSLRARLSMRQYCTNQLNDDSGRYLYVPGFRGASLDVDEVFVPLALDLGGRDLSFSSSTFLDAGNRLLIVGDPGCGKSTLLKQAFREVCRTTQAAPTKGRLPIRLELK